MKAVYENKSNPIESSIQKKLGLRPHLHKEIEIVYVKKGNARAYADVVYKDIEEGDIFICFPNQVHYYECSQVGEYYVLIVSPKVLFGLSDTLYSMLPENNCFKAVKEIEKLVKSAHLHNKNGDVSRAAGCLNLLIAEILESTKLKPTLRQSSGSIREVLDYCEKHFADEISLGSVAEETHLSRCYVSHLFNSKLSMGFTDYINILRINAACEMLNESDKKISDISGDVGYGTIRSFNRAFVKILGQTPQSYRSGIKNA